MASYWGGPQGILPSASIYIAGILIGFNVFSKNDEFRWTLLAIYCFDMPLFSICYHITELGHPILYVELFGFTFSFYEQNGTQYSITFQPKILSLICSSVLFVLLLFSGTTSSILITMVPILTSKLSVLGGLMSFLAFSAFTSLCLFIQSVARLYYRKESAYSALLMPIFHYRLWTYLMVLPAVFLNTAPLYVVIAALSLTTILDIIKSAKYYLLRTLWVIIGFEVSIFSYYQEEQIQRASQVINRFSIWDFLTLNAFGVFSIKMALPPIKEEDFSCVKRKCRLYFNAIEPQYDDIMLLKS